MTARQSGVIPARTKGRLVNDLFTVLVRFGFGDVRINHLEKKKKQNRINEGKACE